MLRRHRSTRIVSKRKLQSYRLHLRDRSRSRTPPARSRIPRKSNLMQRPAAFINRRNSSLSSRRSLSVASSRSSIASARSRSRTLSPIFPKTHFRSSRRTHGKLSYSNIEPTYHVNKEISRLASIFKNSRRSLPPIRLPHTKESTVWPRQLPVFAISINPTRQDKFKRRFQEKSTIWQGTNGKTLDLTRMKREGTIVYRELTRGEIGCYDSHLRLWRKLVADKVPMAIICEDDVNLIGDSSQAQYLNALLNEIKTTRCDFLFLSWFRPAGGSIVTQHTRKQWCFHQLWAYLVTYDGLVKALADSHVKQMHMPVDVALWDAHSRGVIRNLVAYPPLCLTVGERSDTRNIK